MSDEPGSQPATPATVLTPAPAAGPTCPWCSAALTDASAERCPACGAQLVEVTASEIPGVTTVDPSLLRVATATPPKRGVLGALTRGEPARAVPEAPVVPPSSIEALEPPSAAVRQEMRRLRLELEAAAAAEAAEAEAAAAAQAEPHAPAAGGGSSPASPPDAALPGLRDARPGGD